MNLLGDIYYNRDYVSLYLKEDEEIFEFRYTQGDYYFYNISIKRPIKEIAGVKITGDFYDLETAYGYGGYLCNTNSEGFIQNAIKAYNEKCLEENIIAEFVRYHPFNDSHRNLKNFFDFLIVDRKTVYVNLEKNKEERWNNYSSKTRNILRKCERELHLKESNDILTFINLYQKTMDRNNAEDYYYFKESYFQKLMKNENISLYNVYKDETLVSSSFFLFSKDFGHYHLSANNYDLRKYNANYFILDQIFEIARQKNINYFHLGGGRTSDENDTLLKFKKKFSSLEKNFLITGKIFNENIYHKFIKIWEQENPDKSIKYFLKYRL